MGTHLEERERGLQERGTALQAQIEQAATAFDGSDFH